MAGQPPADLRASRRARQRCKATAKPSPPANSLAIVSKDLEYLHQHAGKELGSVKEAHDLVSQLSLPRMGQCTPCSGAQGGLRRWLGTSIPY